MRFEYAAILNRESEPGRVRGPIRNRIVAQAMGFECSALRVEFTHEERALLIDAVMVFIHEVEKYDTGPGADDRIRPLEQLQARLMSDEH